MKTKLNKTSRKRDRYILIISLLILFSGIIVFMSLGLERIKNYYELKTFIILNIILGFTLGLGLLSFIKSKIKLSGEGAENYLTIKMFSTLGLIGHFLFLTSIINTSYSNKIHCDDFEILGKSKQRFVIKKAEYIYYLHVNIYGQQQEVICNERYWNKIKIGEKTNICKFDSRIGFDYLILTDEKKASL